MAIEALQGVAGVHARTVDLEHEPLPTGAQDVVVLINYLQRDLFAGAAAALAPPARRAIPIRLACRVVRLEAVEGATLHVSGIDLLDGTPVLDVKPYVPAFDVFAAERIGWPQPATIPSSSRRPAPPPRRRLTSRRPREARSNPVRAGGWPAPAPPGPGSPAPARRVRSGGRAAAR